MNEWAIVALRQKGIEITKSGKFRLTFADGKVQEVANIEAAIRQQKHIMEQQKSEQIENERNGLIVREFCDIVNSLEDMSIKTFTEKKKQIVLAKLLDIIEVLSPVRNEIRKQTLKKLENVYRMIQQNNIPAAILAANAALDRLRKRWMTNEKVIEISLLRIRALLTLVT